MNPWTFAYMLGVQDHHAVRSRFDRFAEGPRRGYVQLLEAQGQVRAQGLARARTALMRVLREHIPASARVRFGIVQVGIPEFAAEIEQELRLAYGVDVEVLTAPATPVIATHLGIGAWGVAYMVED